MPPVADSARMDLRTRIIRLAALDAAVIGAGGVAWLMTGDVIWLVAGLLASGLIVMPAVIGAIRAQARNRERGAR